MVGGMAASSSASTLSCPIARNIVVRSVSESPTWRWTNSGTASTKTDLISYEFGARRTKELRSEEHTSELQSRGHLVCRLLLEKKQYKLKNRPKNRA